MTVARNDSTSRFELVEDGHIAFLEFEQDGSRLVLVHTEVPDELQGRGIAGRLAKGAFDHARENGLRVTVLCEFVQGWLDRHPEARDLVDS